MHVILLIRLTFQLTFINAKISQPKVFHPTNWDFKRPSKKHSENSKQIVEDREDSTKKTNLNKRKINELNNDNINLLNNKFIQPLSTKAEERIFRETGTPVPGSRQVLITTPQFIKFNRIQSLTSIKSPISVSITSSHFVFLQASSQVHNFVENGIPSALAS